LAKLRRVFVVLTLVAGAGYAAGQAAKPDPVGDWLVSDATAIIRIARCADALCGNVAWTKNPGGVDENNPDPAKRSRPILGLPILLDMKPAGDNRWDGDVYNADNGKTYTSHIWLKSPDVLRIEGCVLGILCGGQDWSRTAQLQTTAPPPAPKGKPAPAAKGK
jgi:uncharacterized protein (DUF2147 family)